MEFIYLVILFVAVFSVYCVLKARSNNKPDQGGSSSGGGAGGSGGSTDREDDIETDGRSFRP